MTDSIKFSIVLPVHNGITHIKECVNSVLNQTYENFDLIVLENHSNDGTREFLETISDNRIKIFVAESFLPMEDNWMRINNIPKNEFFAIIGHDDVYDNNYLEVMNNLISNNPNASLYQAHFRFISSNGQFIRSCLPMAENQFSFEFLACQLQRTLDSMGTGYMMRSTDFDKVGGLSSYKNMIFGDYDLWFKLTNISFKVTAIEECFSYREHYSISMLTNSQDYQKAMFEYLFLIKKLASKSSKLKLVIDRYAPEYLNYMNKGLMYRELLNNKNKISIKRLFENFQAKSQKFLSNQHSDLNHDIYIKIYVLIDKIFITRFIFRELMLIKLKIKSGIKRQFFNKL